MTRKLRRKFVLVSTLSVFIMIVTIFTTINIVNFNILDKKVDMLIYVLEVNDGIFPRLVLLNPQNSKLTFTPSENDFFHKLDKHPDKRINLPREAMFETRFFIAYLDDQDKVLYTDTRNIFSMSVFEAEDFAKKILLSEKQEGYENKYKFKKTTIQGKKAIIFLDTARDLEMFDDFLWTSVQISVVALILTFIITYVLSSYAIRPIVTAYDKQKKFITNSSHEIKTPLSVISANLDIIELHGGESKWVTNSKNQIKTLTELVNNLVSLARMEETTTIDKNDINLSELSEMVAESFEIFATTQGKSFSYKIDKNIVYKCNEKTISQLLYILLDNAFKYSNDGGKIEFSVSEMQGKKLILLTNTVNYIEKGYHNDFFDRFYRADESHNNEKKGFGIGLSLAKSIVFAHKGKITAKSINSNSFTVEILL